MIARALICLLAAWAIMSAVHALVICEASTEARMALHLQDVEQIHDASGDD